MQKIIFMIKSTHPEPRVRKDGVVQKYHVRNHGAVPVARPALFKAPEVRNAAGKLLAPNGQVSKLTEGQWHQVRSPQFKAWFGDWGLAAAFSVSRTGSTFDEARAQAKAFQGEPLKNAETGIVATVSRNNLDKMLSSKAVKKSESASSHAFAVANLDQLFSMAILGWSKPDAGGDTNIKAIHSYFAPVTRDGLVQMVKMTVKETMRSGQSNPLYTVEAVEFNENTPAAQWVDSTVQADGLDPTSIRSARHVRSVAQRIQDYNTGSASKVVDPQTGEPLVVFHGTRSDFDVADTKKSLRLPGFWLAHDAKLASTYAAEGLVNPSAYKEGANVMPLFAVSKRMLRYNPKKQSFQAAWDDYQNGDYDGFIEAGNDSAGATTLVVKNGNQVKSATGNSGAFSLADNSLTKALLAMPRIIFFRTHQPC